MAERWDFLEQLGLTDKPPLDVLFYEGLEFKRRATECTLKGVKIDGGIVFVEKVSSKRHNTHLTNKVRRKN